MPELHLSWRRRLVGVLVLLSLLVQLPLASAAAAEPAKRPEFARAIQAQLTEALGRARHHSGASGLSMAILKHDEGQWVGVSGRHATGAPLSSEDPLRIGSVTKTFTAAIILSLVDEGRVDLDLRADRYVHGIPQLRQVTIRQLLNHTSGIQDLYGPALHYLHGSANRALTATQVLRPLATNRAPGRVYSYSNTNDYLLGLVVEAVTGHSFSEELQARFGTPLRLDRTRMVVPGDDALPAAWSSAFWSAGAMVSTPRNLSRWGRALYGGGLLSKHMTRAMTDFESDRNYDLGAQRLRLGSRWVPGHSGLLYDTTSLLVYLPAERITVAIIGTAPHTDLQAALVRRYGGPSLMDVIGWLGG